MSRWIKRLCTWTFVVVIVVLTLQIMIRHHWQVANDDMGGKIGLGLLFHVSPFFDGTNALSFATFFNKMKQEYPDLVGFPCAANPFPGVLPKNRVYARVLELPRGLDGLDPASTPLMWDARPLATGTMAVLFMDGHSKTMRMSELKRAIEAVRSHGGSVWLGPDAHE